MDPTLVTDPVKQSVLSAWVGNMIPVCLFVVTACLFVLRLIGYGLKACHSSSMTGHVKKCPGPYILLVRSSRPVCNYTVLSGNFKPNFCALFPMTLRLSQPTLEL